MLVADTSQRTMSCARSTRYLRGGDKLLKWTKRQPDNPSALCIAKLNDVVVHRFLQILPYPRRGHIQLRNDAVDRSLPIDVLQYLDPFLVFSFIQAVFNCFIDSEEPTSRNTL